jgi:hypothetical protein
VLRYLYQRIGFQCFTETLFEDAGKHLFNGELDPRLLVSYYPELTGSLFTADDVMDVFAGVAEHMPRERSVEDISEPPSHIHSPFFVLCGSALTPIDVFPPFPSLRPQFATDLQL